MSKKKKVFILSGMVLLLAVTAVLNFVLTTDKTVLGNEASVTAANYFVQYRTERTSSRSEQLIQIDEVIASSAEGSDVRNEALALKLKLTKITEHELMLEKMIKAKGYEDSVVSIGLTSDNINVIVKAPDFGQDDAIIIYSILQEEAGAVPDNVNIIDIS